MMLLGVAAEVIQLTHEMCEDTALIEVRVAFLDAADGQVANALAHRARGAKMPCRPEPTLSFELGGSCVGQRVGNHEPRLAHTRST
jgi:hypothetical protein